MLVGNKCDLADQRVITTKQGQELAKEWCCQFNECSAKSRIFVDDIFIELIRMVGIPPVWHLKRKKNGGCVIL